MVQSQTRRGCEATVGSPGCRICLSAGDLENAEVSNWDSKAPRPEIDREALPGGFRLVGLTSIQAKISANATSRDFGLTGIVPFRSRTFGGVATTCSPWEFPTQQNDILSFFMAAAETRPQDARPGSGAEHPLYAAGSTGRGRYS